MTVQIKKGEAVAPPQILCGILCRSHLLPARPQRLIDNRSEDKLIWVVDAREIFYLRKT